MAKEKKAAKAAPKKIATTAEEKKAQKAKMKTLKAERDAAISEKDKKKIKAARYKIKKINLNLKRMKVIAPEAPAKEEKKEGAAG
jgi:hypothetical protein